MQNANLRLKGLYYISLCICVCMCVCVSDRGGMGTGCVEGEREKDGKMDGTFGKNPNDSTFFSLSLILSSRTWKRA